VENSGGVIGEEGECGDADVELLARERRSLDIFLSVKKEERLSARTLVCKEVYRAACPFSLTRITQELKVSQRAIGDHEASHPSKPKYPVEGCNIG